MSRQYQIMSGDLNLYDIKNVEIKEGSNRAIVTMRDLSEVEVEVIKIDSYPDDVFKKEIPGLSPASFKDEELFTEIQDKTDMRYNAPPIARKRPHGKFNGYRN